MREKYATWDGPLSRSEEHIDDIDVDFYTFYLVEAKKKHNEQQYKYSMKNSHPSFLFSTYQLSLLLLSFKWQVESIANIL